MSYLVLARKWRPMTFEEVIGQKHVVITIQNAIKSNRLANAYLFAGPRGVGKTTVARILAKAINCENGPTPTPCNECAYCQDITQGRSLDVLEIDGASNRGIDEVRNLRENIKYAPSRGKHKIYIIDEVHMLTDPAFNALLKTLEEPPKNVMFIFATTEPHRILPTILSRCQRFDFKRITHAEIMEHLKNMSEKESIKIEAEALHLIATKSDGSMRDAQSLLDQAVSFSGEEITSKEVAELLGVIDQEIFFRTTQLLSKKDRKAGLELIDEIFKSGFDLTEYLAGLNEHLRNILLVKATHSVDLLETSDSITDKYRSGAEDFGEQDLLRLINIISDTEYLIKRSANKRLTLEIALMKLINVSFTKEIDVLLTEIGDIKNQISNTDLRASVNVTENKQTPEKKNDNPVRIAEKVTTKAENNSKTVRIEDVQERWPEIVDEVKKIKIAMGSFLNEGVPTKIEDNTVVISFGTQNGFHMENVMKNPRIIENMMNKLLQADLRIRCIKDSSLVTDEKAVDQGRDIILEKLASEVSQVKTILEVFDVEIIR
ncbi:MAG: DNA polymerase III subunit gamma/tau [candidate division KSB1 bacterium]|jgi:DNA polymerase-3 subunit gamma/tau|nr:DNA polymerase III subunit gamma/tau [candidate division KSB1 bacterium]